MVPLALGMAASLRVGFTWPRRLVGRAAAATLRSRQHRFGICRAVAIYLPGFVPSFYTKTRPYSPWAQSHAVRGDDFSCDVPKDAMGPLRG